MLRYFLLRKLFNERILNKNGRRNIFLSHLPNKNWRYFKDLGNTLINTRWRWILLCLIIANSVAYVLFALAWMAAAIHNGDLIETDESLRCIVGTTNFTGYLLLSIETITTIGFGVIYPTDCHEGWVIITLQALVGVAIEGALVTAVYVKLTRPATKNTLRMFSKKAVVSIMTLCCSICVVTICF